ncbi:nucleolar zinc-finger protein [Serendipita sp. 405]|nr:nucleolar zinc-finger protein [Serendipita sp. 405]
MTSNNNAFPSIGSLAEKTDALQDREEMGGGHSVSGVADHPSSLSSRQEETTTTTIATKGNEGVGGEGRGADTKGEEKPLYEIESLCMVCGEQGMTRMMLTSIPYFKEVIVSSFFCEHCSARNNEVQSAGTIRDFGLVYTIKVLTNADLNRQLVKSQYCTVTVPEFELTIPPSKGQLTTIEGLLKNVMDDLAPEQPLRRIQSPAAYEKIQSILDRLKDILPDYDSDNEEDGDGDGDGDSGEKEKRKEDKKDPERAVPPFTLKLEDPSGNSFVEFLGSMADPKWNMREYHRTKEDNVLLGLVSQDEAPVQEQEEGGVIGGGPPTIGDLPSASQELSAEGTTVPDMDEIFVFPGSCSSCSRPLDTKMKRVVIPYFKEIIIMSTNCEACGYRDNEVKSSGAMSERGKRITLKVEDTDDLSRDILKSDTCGLSIPEIDLVLSAGTLGGRFTTIEGILDQVYDELSGKLFSSGDAATKEENATFEDFLSRLKDVKAGNRPFTLILDDPLSNSYLQNLYAPDPDPNMVIELYDRTKEQDDDLGISDMKLEGYEQDEGDEIPAGHSLETLKEEPEAEPLS